MNSKESYKLNLLVDKGFLYVGKERRSFMDKKTKIIALFSAAALATSIGAAIIATRSSFGKLYASGDDYTITINPTDVTTSTTSSTSVQQFTVKTDQLKNNVTFDFKGVKYDSGTGNLVIEENGFIANAEASQIRSIKALTVDGNADVFTYNYGWEVTGAGIDYSTDDTYAWANDVDVDLSVLTPNYIKMAYRSNNVAISKITITFDKECVVGSDPDVIDSGIRYRKVNNDHYVVIGFSGASSATVVIENTINGLPVTEIADYAFRNDNTIEIVSLGENVTKVGTYAFNQCYSLSTVTGLNDLEEIGAHAFQYCGSLTQNLVFTSSLSSIGNAAFMDSNVHNVTFADTGNPYVADAAFRDIDELESVHIGSEMTQFYDNLCYNYSLESITVGAGNTVYSAPENVLLNNQSKYVVCIAANRPETAFTIPENYTLRGYCCYGNKTLETLTLNSTLTVIPDYSFNWCENLHTINWGSVNGLKIEVAFSDCTALEDLNFSSGVDIVGQRAFDGCTNLTSVVFQEGCTTIQKEAFKDCTKLNNVELPTTLTNLGQYGGYTVATNDIFEGCTSLKVVISRLEDGNTYTGPDIASNWYGNGVRELYYHSDTPGAGLWHVEHSTPTTYDTKTIYVQANATYDADGSFYAIWAWNSVYDGCFYYDHDGPTSYLYEIEVPKNYQNMMIMRMASGTDASAYTYNFPEGKVWNQSGSYLVVDDDLATITGWGLDVNWSTHA